MERFIVGSGRCGSTLLSLMLAQHPRVLNLSEFFNGLDMATRFEKNEISGSQFSDRIGVDQFVVPAVMRRGYEVEEVVYPFDAPGSRYKPGEVLPWLLVTFLPRISADPDHLLDRALSVARSAVPQSPAQHYRSFFEFLGETTGRDCWIERSGSSIHYFPDLYKTFPKARFLHLHRDGREVALSMREHHAYRLPICLMYDAPLDDGSRIADLGPIDFEGQPDGQDPISRILSSRPSPEYFGRYWSDQIQAAIPTLQTLGSDQLLTLAFEDLVRSPRKFLPLIADFFDLPSAAPNWVDDAAGLIHGIPRPRYGQLSAQEKAPLDAACQPVSSMLQDFVN